MCVLCLVSTPCFAVLEYQYFGIGCHASFVIPQAYKIARNGPSAGFGFQGIVNFHLGKVGHLQYMPGIAFWYRRDDWTSSEGVPVEEVESQLSLYMFDVKYVPSFDRILIKPFIGLSLLPNAVHNKYTRESTNNPTYIHKNGDPSLDLFAGVDIPITKQVVPFIETRYTLSGRQTFKISGGLNYCFR